MQVRDLRNGARGTRTPDLLGAIQALSQLSYSPAGRGPTGWRPAQASVVAEHVLAMAVRLGGVMGLLDDAIREHLDLKRRRGADPSEIARAEHEALEPIFPEEPSLDGEAALAEDAPPPTLDAEQEAPPELDQPDAVPPETYVAPPADQQDFSNVGQETAELDMQAVLDADTDHLANQAPSAAAPAPATRPVRASSSSQLPEQDSLEWDVPGRSQREPVPEEVPGQERMSFE